MSTIISLEELSEKEIGVLTHYELATPLGVRKGGFRYFPICQPSQEFGDIQGGVIIHETQESYNNAGCFLHLINPELYNHHSRAQGLAVIGHDSQLLSVVPYCKLVQEFPGSLADSVVRLNDPRYNASEKQQEDLLQILRPRFQAIKKYEEKIR